MISELFVKNQFVSTHTADIKLTTAVVKSRIGPSVLPNLRYSVDYPAPTAMLLVHKKK